MGSGGNEEKKTMNYTSSIKIGSLPLVSVVLENKRMTEAKPAVGVIAVGQYAYGFITLSQFGVGVICISQFGVGLIGVFQFGLAAFSVAQFSVNLVSGYGQTVINLGRYIGL